MNIGKKIKHYRIKNNLTQLELAERIHISDRTISNYEKGNRIPSIDILKNIANELNIPLSVLVDKNIFSPSGDKVYLNELLSSIENRYNDIVVFGIDFGVLRITDCFPNKPFKSYIRIIPSDKHDFFELLERYGTNPNYYYLDFDTTFE